jgi:uncharacterized protein (TIGR03382 family)
MICMSYLKKQQILGWLAVGLSTAIACFWAMWGIIENFHEGWFYDSLLANLGLMFVQYLSPMLIFVGLSLLSIYLPRIGSIAHVALGVLLPLFLRRPNFAVIGFITLPLVLLGLLYWLGRRRSRKAASAVVIGLPLLTLIVCGVGPAFRVAGRVNDGNLQARLVEGNSVRLIWAADGIGWPREGVNWYEATKRCQYLEEDGRTLAAAPQNIWRLSTVEEAVRSMSRHGANSGGMWDSQNRTASYQTTPDKESPLWNIHSQVIYWWTATEADEQNAYIIVYDGNVSRRRKQIHPGYLAFRCVKSP